MKSKKLNRYANPVEQWLNHQHPKEAIAHQESPRLRQKSQPMATKTQASQDPQGILPLRATPQAKNQVPTPVTAEETATLTMTVVAADATLETATGTAIAIAEDAAATTTAKRQNQKSLQTTF
jgi:hypothetical protein